MSTGPMVQIRVGSMEDESSKIVIFNKFLGHDCSKLEWRFIVIAIITMIIN